MADELEFLNYIKKSVDDLKKGIDLKRVSFDFSIREVFRVANNDSISSDILHEIDKNLNALGKKTVGFTRNFDYKEYIKCFKYPKKGTLKESIMYNPKIYRIFNDENFKDSIPYVIKEMYERFDENEKRVEHYISEFSKALGLKKDRVKYDLELIWPDLFDENNGKLDSYSALIVSKYLDKDAFEKLALTCKKFKETPEKLKFNPIPLTDKKTRDLFPNLETQYIYSEKDMVFADGKIGQYHIEDGVRFNKCESADALASIKLYKMEKITGAMFADLKKLKKIILPDSVKEIGEGAFGECTSLQTVYSTGGELDEKLKQEIIEQCGHEVEFVRK